MRKEVLAKRESGTRAVRANIDRYIDAYDGDIVTAEINRMHVMLPGRSPLAAIC